MFLFFLFFSPLVFYSFFSFFAFSSFRFSLLTRRIPLLTRPDLTCFMPELLFPRILAPTTSYRGDPSPITTAHTVRMYYGKGSYGALPWLTAVLNAPQLLHGNSKEALIQIIIRSCKSAVVQGIRTPLAIFYVFGFRWMKWNDSASVSVDYILFHSIPLSRRNAGGTPEERRIVKKDYLLNERLRFSRKRGKRWCG